MNAKLRIRHGKLQTKRGQSSGQDVQIRGEAFVIGSGKQCSLRCQSSSVAERHCVLMYDGADLIVRDLQSETGTLVNQQPVEDEHVLLPGDVLRVGRLEFEVVIEEEVEQPLIEQLEDDQLVDEVLESLGEADEKARDYRQHHPELRMMELDTETASKERESKPAEEENAGKGRKKKPGKLPKPPAPPMPKDSTTAAEESLRKLFERG